MQPTTLHLLVREIWAGNIRHAFPNRRPIAAAEENHSKLTPRELEVLHLVADGASNGLIARQLWVTEQTVKFNLSTSTGSSAWATARRRAMCPSRRAA